MTEIPRSDVERSIPAQAVEQLDSVVTTAIRDGVTPSAMLAVMHRGELVYEGGWGWQDPETKTPIRQDCLYDLASVTKLFTVTAFLAQVSAGKATLDMPLAAVVPEFAAISPRSIVDSYDPINRQIVPMDPAHVGKLVAPTSVTMRHLLTHTSGLPPWRQFYAVAGPSPTPPGQLDPMPRELRWARIFASLCTVDFAGLPGDKVRYTDIGLMLLGEAVARISGQPLENAIRARVISAISTLPDPISFNPVDQRIGLDRIVPTEYDSIWRRRRIHGEVHDENACAAGGVAGHAGLFASAETVARFGQLWLEGAGGFNIAPELAAEAVREQVVSNDLRRGLGFVIKPHVGANCGDLMSPETFGHTGFTGTSLWIDPRRKLVVALLTNSVYHGRSMPGTYELRRAVHTILAEALS
ncbi:MAG: beta-lactamase family protein [Chloroflexi bacterium]|nr:beta-lactamase family protein [Chloroflexota bacterium]